MFVHSNVYFPVNCGRQSPRQQNIIPPPPRRRKARSLVNLVAILQDLLAPFIVLCALFFNMRTFSAMVAYRGHNFHAHLPSDWVEWFRLQLLQLLGSVFHCRLNKRLSWSQSLCRLATGRNRALAFQSSANKLTDWLH
jgi:hypothetical protein